MSVNYEVVGKHYATQRQPDNRIARVIHTELSDVESIVNIGAGTGSYEPTNKIITAVEPSETMIAQRKPRKNTNVYQAFAENLPFDSNSFDASLAILTIHLWKDWKKGIQEAKRVARIKVVLFTWINMQERFWLADFFPEIEQIDTHLFPTLAELSDELGNIRVIPVAIPSDCTDGFMYAYWARPELYLDSRVRSAISTFSHVQRVEEGVIALSSDLNSGAWHKKYGDILKFKEIDFGYRLVVAEI